MPGLAADRAGVAVPVPESLRGMSRQPGHEQFRHVRLLPPGRGRVFEAVRSLKKYPSWTIFVFARPFSYFDVLCYSILFFALFIGAGLRTQGWMDGDGNGIHGRT